MALVGAQSAPDAEEDEVVFVKERRVERCRCGVVGKAVCDRDITSFEGCVDGGEECRRERAHADDLMAAGVKWCRTFLVTGISAGRCLEPNHKTGLFPHKTLLVLNAEVTKLQCLVCNAGDKSGVKRRAEEGGEDAR